MYGLECCKRNNVLDNEESGPLWQHANNAECKQRYLQRTGKRTADYEQLKKLVGRYQVRQERRNEEVRVMNEDEVVEGDFVDGLCITAVTRHASESDVALRPDFSTNSNTHALAIQSSAPTRL
jgi:hypothetical protein